MLPGTPSRRLVAAALVTLLLGTTAVAARPALLDFPNAAGSESTLVSGPAVDPSQPFFQDLGANGRRCVTCHDPGAGWTVTPALVQARFEATAGLDPLFRPHDGAVAPTADVSSESARRAAYRLLLERGLIRVGIPLPPGADFSLEGVADPAGYASAAELSMFRRPLPATNLRFHPTIMWDGRETAAGPTLNDRLRSQAQGAHVGHAQGTPLPDPTLQQVVDLESGLHTAQRIHAAAGRLDGGARGGPRRLSRQAYYAGMNHPFQRDPRGRRFNRRVFTLFGAWRSLSPRSPNPRGRSRALIALGEQIFNTRSFRIRGVQGLNDLAGAEVIDGTCSTCHNVPNVGTFSLDAPMNLGIEGVLAPHPSFPRYTFRNLATQETLDIADPGQALITGRWADMGRFKTPSLRGLASRAPYFHDGSAATLEEVVDFYVARFGLSLRAEEILALAEFMRAL